MYRTFNMGIGMCVIVSNEDVEITRTILEENGEKTYLIGEIRRGEGKVILE